MDFAFNCRLTPFVFGGNCNEKQRFCRYCTTEHSEPFFDMLHKCLNALIYYSEFQKRYLFALFRLQLKFLLKLSSLFFVF